METLTVNFQFCNFIITIYIFFLLTINENYVEYNTVVNRVNYLKYNIQMTIRYIVYVLFLYRELTILTWKSSDKSNI